MKISVRQMNPGWNLYAYVAEDVEEAHWDFFQRENWWQLGNSFIKQFKDVPDFEYCAQNFAECGQVWTEQSLKIRPTPWKDSLGMFSAEMERIGVPWILFGSCALSLQGVEVDPPNINVMALDFDDYEKLREHFKSSAVMPFERCDGWLYSGSATLFMDASVNLIVKNKDDHPDLGLYEKVDLNGHIVYLETLKMLRDDNDRYGRLDRVKMIEERMRQKSSEQLLDDA
jgi:hypothetical protein